MTESILESIKEKVGIKDPTITAFDSEILMDINMAFAILTRIGLPPESGFRVEDKETTWDEIIGDDPRLECVKEYVAIQVKLMFDSNSMSNSMIDIYKERANELEYTIITIVDPDPLNED